MTHPPSSKQKNLVIGAISFLIFLLNIDYTAANLALLPIADDVGADLNTLQWVLSAYVLIWGALVVPAGRLADLYGKRRALLLGVGVFVLGSWVTGVGTHVGVVIFGRVLQGIGGAIFAPPCYGLMFSITPPEHHGRVMGIFTAASGLGLAVGPTLAGVILEALNWRWIFYINMPIGALVFFSIYRFAPKDCLEQGTGSLDTLGTFLLTLGLGGLMIGLNQVEVWGVGDPLFWGVLGVSFLVLWCFYRRNQNYFPQTFPKSLGDNKPFLIVSTVMFLTAIHFSLILIMVGLFIQKVLHYSSYHAGFIFLMMTVSYGALSPFAGRLADRVDLRLPVAGGLCALFLGMGGISFLKGDQGDLYPLLMCLFFSGIGLGLSFPALNVAMMRCAQDGDVNTASGVFTMGTMLGNTIGVIFSTSLLVIFTRHYVEKQLSMAPALALQTDWPALMAHITTIHTHQGGPLSLSLPLSHMVNDGFMHGIAMNMRIGAALAVLALFLVMYRIRDCRILRPAGSSEKTMPIIPHS